MKKLARPSSLKVKPDWSEKTMKMFREDVKILKNKQLRRPEPEPWQNSRLMLKGWLLPLKRWPLL